MLKTLRFVFSLLATVLLLFSILGRNSNAMVMAYIFISLTFIITGIGELKNKERKASYFSFAVAGFILVFLVLQSFLA